MMVDSGCSVLLNVFIISVCGYLVMLLLCVS